MKILILSLSDPDLASHGGTIRTRAFSSVFRSLGHEVSVLFPENAPGEKARARSLNNSRRFSMLGKISALKRHYLPMPTRLGAVDPKLLEKVQSYNADIVVVSALSLSSFALAANCALWIDFMDMWSQFGLRESGARRGIARITARLQSEALRRAESELLSQADVATAAGFADVKALEALAVGPKIHWLPTWLEGVQPLPSNESSPKVAGFVGNFDFWPNVDAYNALVSDWMPTLVKCGIRVVIAGRHAERLTPHPNIEILGELDDITDFYRAIDFSLAPVRLGGGIKVKVVESLLFGRPVLGTPAAFEGMPPATQPGAVMVSAGLEAELVDRVQNAFVSQDALGSYTRPFAEAVIAERISNVQTALSSRRES